MAIGFRKAIIEEPGRLCISVCGKEKEGKTHFALTAPEPIRIFDMDNGLEGPIARFKKKDIQVKKYSIPNIGSPSMAEKLKRLWEEFQKDFRTQLIEAAGGTIIIDSGTQMYRLCRQAHFGGKLKQNAQHYDIINSELDNLWSEAKGQNTTNVIVIHQLKVIFESSPREWEPSGWPGTGYSAHGQVLVEKKKGKYTATVSSCRHTPEAEGKVLPGPLCNFDAVAEAMLPGWSDRQEEDE